MCHVDAMAASVLGSDWTESVSCEFFLTSERKKILNRAFWKRIGLNSNMGKVILHNRGPLMNNIPIPNGMKHSFLSNFPSSSRKRDGLKASGSSHTLGSLWTDHRLGKTTVPLGIV